MDSANSSTNIFDYSKFFLTPPCPIKRASFLATYRRNQAWSLPDSIIYYITKNPASTKMYEKLIQACKYFFLKNPILIVSKLFIDYEENECRAFFDSERVDNFLHNISSKLWITDTIIVEDFDETAASEYLSSVILPNTYKSDIKQLTACTRNISFDALVLTATNCEDIDLNGVTVKDENGDVVTLERIIEALPNVKTFKYYFKNVNPSVFTSKTVKEMVKIPHFKTLDELKLGDVPESFDLDDFYSYIKENKKTAINFSYYYLQISDAYKQRLQEIVNEIIQTVDHQYKIPSIDFPDIDYASYHKLCNLQLG